MITPYKIAGHKVYLINNYIGIFMAKPTKQQKQANPVQKRLPKSESQHKTQPKQG